ncbi:MAG: hypothetical protein JWP89_2644 [Schlesneria sp.]|nr:hypothetical protein [Schlesneria sp.]
MPNNERIGGVEFEASVDTTKLENSGQKVDAAFTKLERSTRQTQKALDYTEKSAGFLGATFTRLTGAFTAANIAATVITRGIRLLATTFIDSIKNAANFETILARISTVVEGSTKPQIKALGDQVIEMSKRFPKSKEELGVGLYNILQSGVEDTSDAMKILEISTKAAIGGVTDVGTATKVVTNIMGAYNITADEAAKVMDSVFVGAQKGKAEFSDLAGSMGNVLQSAAQLDVGIPEVVAAIETMVNAGLSADEASTSLNAFFTSVLNASKGTGDAADLAKKLNLEFDSTALRTKGLRKFMEDLSTAVGDDEVSMQILSGNVRGFRAAASIGGKGADFFTSTLDAMGDSAGAVDAAFNKMADTTEANFTLATNAASNAAGTFGGETLPAVNRALEQFTGFMNAATPVAAALGTAVGFMIDAIRIGLSELPKLIPFMDQALQIANAIQLAMNPKVDQSGVFTGAITSTGPAPKTVPTAHPHTSGSGGGSGDKAQKAWDEMLSAFKEQADANKDNLQARKDELMLRQKLGVLTKAESTELDRINNRLEFSDDKIKDMTDNWDDLNGKIKDSKDRLKDLQQQLDDLNKDSSDDRVSKLMDLLREKAQLEQLIGSSQGGLTGDQSKRLGDIQDIVNSAPQAEVNQAGAKLGQNPGLDNPILQSLQEESDKRKVIQDQIDKETRNLKDLEAQGVTAQQQIVQAVNDRQVQQDKTFKLIEDRQTDHVNKTIAEFNRLKAALSGTPTMPTPAFATGGPVVGAGTGTSDSIAARLSNNEHVITSSEVRQAGGHAGIFAIRNMIRRGELPIQRFATGGPVTNDHRRNATYHITNHGRAAEVFADPRRANWLSRTSF